MRDGNGFFESSILRDEPGFDLRDGPAHFDCEMEGVRDGNGFLKVRICEMNRTTAGQEINQRDEPLQIFFRIKLLFYICIRRSPYRDAFPPRERCALHKFLFRNVKSMKFTHK